MKRNLKAIQEDARKHYNDFLAAIRSWRKTLKLSPAQMAAKLGWDVGALERIEAGRQPLSLFDSMVIDRVIKSLVQEKLPPPRTEPLRHYGVRNGRRPGKWSRLCKKRGYGWYARSKAETTCPECLKRLTGKRFQEVLRRDLERYGQAASV